MLRLYSECIDKAASPTCAASPGSPAVLVLRELGWELPASGAEDPCHDPRFPSGLERKRQDEKRRSSATSLLLGFAPLPLRLKKALTSHKLWLAARSQPLEAKL